MANNGYVTAGDCHSCTKNRIHRKCQLLLKPLDSDGSLDFVGMDILGPPSKIIQGNKLMVAITAHNTKITKAKPASLTIATTIARIFLERWIFDYGIPLNSL